MLNFFATDEGIRSYVLWGMGDFSSVSLGQLPVFCSMLGIGLLLAALLVKPLNALLLGERYAENLGVRVKRVRLLLLVSTGLLTAVVTAFAARSRLSDWPCLIWPADDRLVEPQAADAADPADRLGPSRWPAIWSVRCPGGSGVLPLSAITPVVGAPVIIYVIVNQKRIQYFN